MRELVLNWMTIVAYVAVVGTIVFANEFQSKEEESEVNE